MKELIDKSKLLEELKRCEKICEGYMSSHKDTVSQGIANAKRAVCQHFIKFLDTLEVKEANDAYKQGYNDAIDKFCKFMQSFEGYVVSGNKCNYDNFIKYMEE